jgi:hypothetical protein
MVGSARIKIDRLVRAFRATLGSIASSEIMRSAVMASRMITAA